MVVDFDTVAFHIPFIDWPVHWYGLTYLIGFVGGWWLALQRSKKPDSSWNRIQVDDLLFYTGLGAIIGGRLGYIFFYNFSAFIADPLMLLKVWQGGMSFHGGLLGVMIAMWLLKRRHKKGFFEVVDFLTPFVPVAITSVRIGNFINGELWGKATTLPWGMVFPSSGTDVLRHPSPLYEAFLEGVVMFTILWIFSAKPRPTMAVSALFALLYGVFRFIVEFVRMPDAHIGYVAFGWLTMGQVLSLPLIAIGGSVLWYAYHRPTVK